MSFFKLGKVNPLLSPRTMESMDIYEDIIREEQEEKEATYNEVCDLSFEYGCMACYWFGFAFKRNGQERYVVSLYLSFITVKAKI